MGNTLDRFVLFHVIFIQKHGKHPIYFCCFLTDVSLAVRYSCQLDHDKKLPLHWTSYLSLFKLLSAANFSSVALSCNPASVSFCRGGSSKLSSSMPSPKPPDIERDAMAAANSPRLSVRGAMTRVRRRGRVLLACEATTEPREREPGECLRASAKRRPRSRKNGDECNRSNGLIDNAGLNSIESKTCVPGERTRKYALL